MRVLLFTVCVALAWPSGDAWWSSSGDGSSEGESSEEAESAEDEGTIFHRIVEAVLGAGDMARAYSDMREANWRDSDKYFHARGNHEAAQRGPGGEWAAKVISDIREIGQDEEEASADQEANEWGRNGGDPNVYRPDGLPEQY